MVILTQESYDSVSVGTEKRKGLSRCLKTARDGADATWRGRSFQTVAPETGNARYREMNGRKQFSTLTSSLKATACFVSMKISKIYSVTVIVGINSYFVKY